MEIPIILLLIGILVMQLLILIKSDKLDSTKLSEDISAPIKNELKDNRNFH